MMIMTTTMMIDEEPLSSVLGSCRGLQRSAPVLPLAMTLTSPTGVKSLNACHKDCERSLEPSQPTTSGEAFDDPTVDCEESIYSTSTRLDPDKEGATASDREQDSSEKDVEEMFDVISPEEVLQSMHDPDPMESRSVSQEQKYCIRLNKLVAPQRTSAPFFLRNV